MVKVLAGKRKIGGFSGYWVTFEVEMVSSYEDKGVVYTLYRCSAYDWEAYRVHISNETNPRSPIYELHPCEDRSYKGEPPNYTEPYLKEQLALHYPLFLKDLDYFLTRSIDAKPRPQQS
jgi:hypothetical protein